MPESQLLVGAPNDHTIEAVLSTVNISFAEIDFHATNVNASSFESIPALTSYLTREYRDERSKVRSIFTWIASSIAYDRESYSSSKSINTQTAAAVWQNRSAVCEGYANLFVAMCEAAGIESRMVKGYVRDYSDSELRFPNHAWNSVKINGRWQLLDVTWASIDNVPNAVADRAPDLRDQRQNLDYFFMVDPQRMLLTHLPEDPFWQLQTNYVDLHTFVRGEAAVADVLKNSRQGNEKNFESLIAKYEKLDSLDRSISYLERMESNAYNKFREYGLGIAYYYKAQNIIKEADKKNIMAYQKAKSRARDYYQKSLKCLSELKEDDFGYDFSLDLTDNVSFKMEALQ
jgi:hypothetical protein